MNGISHRHIKLYAIFIKVSGGNIQVIIECLKILQLTIKRPLRGVSSPIRYISK